MAAMGHHHKDVPEHVEWSMAAKPWSKPDKHTSSESMVWQCGMLWDWCPAWHARHSPYVGAASRLLATIAGTRSGVASPREWTAAGHSIALRCHALRELLQADESRRRRASGE